MTQQLLTAAQLAALLQVSVRHIERSVAQGMPSIPVGARLKRYDPAACLAWMAAHAGESTACRSDPQQRAATTSKSASAANAYTAVYRRAQLRVMPSESKPS